MKSFDRDAFMSLKAASSKLTKQQFRTLKGQILAGDSEGAAKGMRRLLADAATAGKIKEDKKATN